MTPADGENAFISVFTSYDCTLCKVMQAQGHIQPGSKKLRLS
jgi:hypothetical protein